MSQHAESKKLLQYLEKFGISYTVTPSTSIADIEAALRPQARVIFMESPGLLSFELQKAGFEAVKSLINRLKLVQIGNSWGSFESLVLSPNEGKNEEQLRSEGISPGLIRISIGLEDTRDLIRDLDEALNGYV